MADVPLPIQRRKLAHEVTERLLGRIRDGEYGPGAQLPSERELMTAYGVGRPAVREALQSLERDGIVVITHGERARVAVPTPTSVLDQIAGAARHLLRIEPDTLEHLKDARLFLELGMARRAALRADDAGIAALAGCLAEQERSDLAGFLGHDMAFHRQIAIMTGNPIFPAIIEAMFGWLGGYYTSLVRLLGAENLTIAEHRRILDAIAARDPDAAETAMREHLTRANALYRRFEQVRP